MIVKKDDQEITLLDSNITSNKDLKKNNFKTTNVNILLNRVRLDKKKNLNKKITILTSLFLSVIAISFLFFK